MIRLHLPREPRWLELGSGVAVFARPLTLALYRAATATAVRKALAVAEEKGLIDDAGGSVADIPDPSDRDGVSGLQSQFMLQALAQHAIAEWRGVGTETGDPAPVTPSAVAALIRDFPLLALRFEAEYLREVTDLAAEGNASGAAPNGTTAAAPDTAPGAIPNAAERAPTPSTSH